MYNEYPNLPLVEEKFSCAILHSIEKAINESQKRFPRAEFSVCVFPQVWPNTAGGFEDGKCFSGQMFITQYTTVIQEKLTGIYGVFFGNGMAYYVEKENSAFAEDLKAQNMKNIKEATKRYGAIRVA